jgi:hypothetical protein
LVDLWFSGDRSEEVNVKPFAVRAPLKSLGTQARSALLDAKNKGLKAAAEATVKLKGVATTAGDGLSNTVLTLDKGVGFKAKAALIISKIKERHWHLDRQRVFIEVVYENKAPAQWPLALACQEGDLTSAIFSFRTDRDGPDFVRRADALGRTPLMLACANGHVAVARWLHKNGGAPDVAGVTYRGSTCMSFACRSGSLETCAWLLTTAGCPKHHLRQPDNAGLTPMHWAAAEGHTPVLHFLRAAGAGADVRSFDAEGYSPVWRASLGNHAAACHWLLLHGAMRARYTSSIPRPEDSEIDQAIYVEVCAAPGEEVSVRAWAFSELEKRSGKALLKAKKKGLSGGPNGMRDDVEEAACLRNLLAFVNHLGPSVNESDGSNEEEPWSFEDLAGIPEDENEPVSPSRDRYGETDEETLSVPQVYVVEEWTPPLNAAEEAARKYTADAEAAVIAHRDTTEAARVAAPEAATRAAVEAERGVAVGKTFETTENTGTNDEVIHVVAVAKDADGVGAVLHGALAVKGAVKDVADCSANAVVRGVTVVKDSAKDSVVQSAEAVVHNATVAKDAIVDGASAVVGSFKKEPPKAPPPPSREDARKFLNSVKKSLAAKPGGFDNFKLAFGGLGVSWSARKKIPRDFPPGEERTTALTAAEKREGLVAAKLVEVFRGVEPAKAISLLESFIAMLVPFECIPFFRAEIDKVFPPSPAPELSQAQAAFSAAEEHEKSTLDIAPAKAEWARNTE